MKSNRQKQRFCHPKIADLKAWSHGVRKANCIIILTDLLNAIKKMLDKISFHKHFKSVDKTLIG